MNGRLKELWEQSKTSGVHPEFGEYDKYSAEKFAELIVRECHDEVERYLEACGEITSLPSYVLLKRFGVEL